MHRFIVCLLAAVWLLAPPMWAAEQKTASGPSIAELIEASQKATASLKSYTCQLTSVTRHKVNGGPYQEAKKNVLSYAFRNPDNIRLQWLEPRRKRGQLAVWDGTILRAAPSWMPFAVTVDPDSPTGLDDFHHPVYNSDVNTLMSKVIQGMPMVVEETYGGQVPVGSRTAHHIELKTIEKRIVLMIDTDHFLPLSIEQYDLESGILFDGGYFEDYKLNPPLDDKLFDL